MIHRDTLGPLPWTQVRRLMRRGGLSGRAKLRVSSWRVPFSHPVVGGAGSWGHPPGGLDKAGGVGDAEPLRPDLEATHRGDAVDLPLTTADQPAGYPPLQTAHQA